MFGDWNQKKRRQYLLLVGGIFSVVFVLLLFSRGGPALSKLPETLFCSLVIPGLISGYYLNQYLDGIMDSRSGAARYSWIILGFLSAGISTLIIVVGGILSVLPGFFYNLVLYLQRRRPKS